MCGGTFWSTAITEEVSGEYAPQALVVEGGKVRQASSTGVLVDLEVSAAAMNRLKSMLPIRDAILELLAAERNDVADGRISELRAELNRRYDEFATKFKRTVKGKKLRGALNAPDNSRLIIKNPDGPSAMAVSLSEKGRIDPDYMGTLLKKDGEAVIKELKDEKRIFMDPGETGAWETSEMYLSGDLARKSQRAEAAPVEMAKDFIEHLLGDGHVVVKLEPSIAYYEIDAGYIC